jgi:hypothetical protein
MDSGRLEDLLQQYITQIYRIYQAKRVPDVNSKTKVAHQRGSGPTNSAIPAEVSSVAER